MQNLTLISPEHRVMEKIMAYSFSTTYFGREITLEIDYAHKAYFGYAGRQ